MKGFIDRLFLPEMAFRYRENSVWWDKLLTGKTAHIIITLNQPSWRYWLSCKRPSVNKLKKSNLGFCGIKTTKITYIGIVKNANRSKRVKWLEKVEVLGKKLLQHFLFN